MFSKEEAKFQEELKKFLGFSSEIDVSFIGVSRNSLGVYSNITVSVLLSKDQSKKIMEIEKEIYNG